MSYSLQPWNSFGIEQNANKIVCVENAKQLLDTWKKSSSNGEPVLIIGEGSNILFIDDFAGTVIINRIMGLKITERIDSWHFHVGAGENWHQLVQFSIKNGTAGLENLALIPGCVGSSPIQNISAYGIELKSVCEYVECIELPTGELCRLTTEECQFGYRDSIFKHEYNNRYAIVAIGLRLMKHWQPILTYDDLTYLNHQTVTPHDVFHAVCYIRMIKLPNPKVQGNAGSFFKNPIISNKAAQTLLTRWPYAPHYLQADNTIKLSAGWLIEQCQLKGTSKGGASVYQQQALVLINKNNATSNDIVQLAHFVRQRVGEKFDVWLEPEVRFIGRSGEVNAIEALI